MGIKLHKGLKLIIALITAGVILTIGALVYDDIQFKRYRFLATSPNAILMKAGLDGIPYDVVNVRHDTVACCPMADEARISYFIRFINTTELKLRVRSHWFNGCWGGFPCYVWDIEKKDITRSGYYGSLHIKVMDDGTALVSAQYPIDYTR